MKEMADKAFRLRTMTDIKVFILFLLDNISGDPVDGTTLIRIIAENTDRIVTDYQEALAELTDAGHIYADTVDRETYYLISDTGRTVARQLYNKLDPAFLESGLRYAHRFLSLNRTGARPFSSVEATGDGRFSVELGARDEKGELFRASFSFPSRAEAEAIRARFLAAPDDIYRALLLAATGKADLLRR